MNGYMIVWINRYNNICYMFMYCFILVLLEMFICPRKNIVTIVIC